MIHVITGHICSGKTTYVKRHARQHDVVIDFDAIAQALSADGTRVHEHHEHVEPIARAARWQAIVAAITAHRSAAIGRNESPFDVWIIHAYPTEEDRRMYWMADAHFHDIVESRDTLLDRALRERGERCVNELRRRLNQAPPGGVGEAEKQGVYGKSHAASARISDQLSPN